MRKSRKGIREIGWGINESDDKVCIYDNGTWEPEEFLKEIRQSCHLDTPADALDSLTIEDVQHLRFRPMSPYEAKAWGADWGVMDCTEEQGPRGYPVTAIIL